MPRFVRGSTTSLSNHAFGSAFDINVPFNRLGARPALVGQKGSVRRLVKTAHRHGFYTVSIRTTCKEHIIYDPNEPGVIANGKCPSYWESDRLRITTRLSPDRRAR